MQLKKYKDFLSDVKSSKRILTEDREKILSNIQRIEAKIQTLSEAREIVSVSAIIAQDSTKEIFEELVTQALQMIFGEEYSFKLDSRVFRNQPEMEMFVVENGVQYSPKDEKGGAVVDVISFSSRIVSLAIQSSEKNIQKVLLLDEPFRCLRKETLVYLAQLMKDISDELGIQIIYITHEKELAEASNREELDRSFLVKKIDDISRVERIL